MDNILTNSGLTDIRDQIFGYFNCETLEICHEVFANKYGEDWDFWLEKLILVQGIRECGKKILPGSYPGWNKAVKKFVKMASLNDLKEVEESLKGLLEDFWQRWPLHYAAGKGHVKLMELLFHTDLNINERRVDIYEHTPFTLACQNGQREIVNLMITSSKKYGIDLNAGDSGGWTGLFHACWRGNTKIVKLIVENRTKYGINIQQETNSGYTALKFVNCRIDVCHSDVKASFEELKDILEKAISADNETQSTV